MFKQAIVLRSDLGMGKGKLAAQAAHASLSAYRKSNAVARRAWELIGEEKIVLKVNSESALTSLVNQAKRLKLPVSLIRDAGHTQIPAGTVTALAIGPAEEKKVDAVTGTLKLL
ncbi:peptidyl-tRNA hydrolase Pth2 [Candidatus Micrarchaeota archaeon]|nr:peptidyl-tRNA hydrolase Pth2 [Candidatus Micrarchaeota archaeon]